MGEWFKWLRSKLKLSRLAFWRKPTPVAVPVAPIAKPAAIVGEKFLENYQALYADFQAHFVRYIRDDNPPPLDDDPETYARRKALYWRNFSHEDIGRIAGEWLLEKRFFISNFSIADDKGCKFVNKFYTDQNGKTIK